MKKIITLIMSIIIIGILAGCGITGKGSKSWLENEVSDIEKVYPTENLEELFEKFPNGFYIRQIILKNGDNINEGYSYILELRGDKDKKTILGKVEKIRTKDEPYERVLIQQSKVEYKKGEGLVLEKPELEDSLLFKKYFLFQKLKLNRDILKKLEVKDKSFSFETYRYNIEYLFTNKEIDDYLGLNKQKVSFDIRGQYSEKYKTYFHTIIIKDDTEKTDFSEKIVEER